MSQKIGLFSSYSPRYRDISKEITRSRERKHIGGLVLAPVLAIECFDPGVGEDGDADAASGGAGRDAGEPLPESFRASV
jgi:hypothetical protein